MSENSKLPDIHIPEDVKYSCQGCGRCCSGWSVGLTDEDYDRVKHTDWQSLHPQLANKELFFHREQEFLDGTAGYPHYTVPKDDGSCPFLIDNLCFIHGHLGENEKPITCRIFPYTFAETPTGVYTGVVFNSMASVRNIGDPLTEQREKLANYFNLTIQHKNAAMRPEAREAQDMLIKEIAGGATAVYKNPFETVSLTPACQIDWQEYLLIEARMLEVVQGRLRRAEASENPEDISIFKTLLMCSEILMQGRKLKMSGGNVADIATFDAEIKTPVDITPSGIELMTLRMLFYRFFVYPTVRTSDSRLWQMQRGKALKGNNAMVVANIFSKYAGSGIQTILFGKAGLEMLGKVNLNAAMSAPFTGLDAETNKLFHRWIYLKLFSKSYFGPAAAGFSVLSGFNCLIASVLSVLLFSKAAALNKASDSKASNSNASDNKASDNKAGNNNKTADGKGANTIAIADIYEAYWRLDRELLTIGQIPAEESRMYNAGLSAPRLFNKGLWAMTKAFGEKM